MRKKKYLGNRTIWFIWIFTDVSEYREIRVTIYEISNFVQGLRSKDGDHAQHGDSACF